MMVVVAAFAAGVHWPALSARAVFFDDDQYVLKNERVLHPSWSAAGDFLTEVLEPTTVGGYYHPLAMISLMVDGALGGSATDLRPFHRTSLALHAANAGLVVLLLWLLFGRPWVALALGLVFAAHPMVVETVCWTSDRKDVLAAFFALISLVAYVRRRRLDAAPAAGAGRRRALDVVCVAGYVLALLSKPASLPLPLVMLLLDWWPLGRLSVRAVVEKLPLFAIAVVSAWIALVSQARTYGPVPTAGDDPLRIPLTIAYSFSVYVAHFFWPLGLSSYYEYPAPFRIANPQVLAHVIASIALVAVVVVSLRWTRGVAVGAGIFFVVLLPAMQIVGFSNVVAADKYAYLPMVGLLVSMAYGAIALRARVGRRMSVPAILQLAAVLLVEIGISRSAHALWRDDETLYQHCVAKAPNTASLRTMLGRALEARGAMDEAESEFRKAFAVRPEYTPGAMALARLLAKRGRSAEAGEVYGELLGRKPHLKAARLALERLRDSALPGS